VSIKDHKWSDDDLQIISVPTKDDVWIYSNYAESDSSLNRDDVKALAAHFELDADHKAALAEKEAELEKARELLRRGRIAAQFMANEKLDGDIAAYLGDKS